MDKTLLLSRPTTPARTGSCACAKRQRQQGLDPNKWFGNVELMVAKDIGQETVQYVSNIYKYYVAYKMAVEQKQVREAAKKTVAEQ